MKESESELERRRPPNNPYPSDLTDEQWEKVEWLFVGKKTPKAKVPSSSAGRPYSATMRQICNGILYKAFTGIPWRFLPRDIHPIYQTIYAHSLAWESDGTLDRFYDLLNLVRPHIPKVKKTRTKMPRKLAVLERA